MAGAFGMELSDMEASVVKLIEEGQIKARIDSQNKVQCVALQRETLVADLAAVDLEG